MSGSPESAGGTPDPTSAAQDGGSARAASAGSLRSRARRGSAWALGGQGVSQALRMVGNIVMSRILSPEAFGLMAIVNLVLQGLQQLSNLGVKPAVVRHPRGDEPRFLATAFSIQALRGAVLLALAGVLAWPVARAYQEPQLALLVAVAGLSPLLLGFQSPGLMTAARALQVHRPVITEVAGRLVAVVVMIGLGLWLRSVWALLLGGIAAAATRLALSHAIAGTGTRFAWDRDVAREILHFGKWIFLSTLLGYLALRVDVAMLGRLVPMETLGVYSIAILVPGIVRETTGALMQSVLMPALAEAGRRAPETLSRSLAAARRILLPVGLLVTLGLVAAAPAFFGWVYDERYRDAGWIAQLSALPLWFEYLQQASGRTLLVLGDSRAWAASNGTRALAATAAGLAGFALGGLPGLVLGLAAAALLGHAVVVLALRSHGVRVAAGDARYTAAALLGGLALGVAPRALAPEAVPLATLGAGALVLGPYGVLVARRAWSESRST